MCFALGVFGGKDGLNTVRPLDPQHGVIPEDALAPKEDWPELHDTYGEVLAKLRSTAPQSND